MTAGRVVVEALCWLVGFWLLWRVPRPEPGEADGPVAVVVPARDEEANLARLLPTLVPQLRPGDEVVVVDDDSADATAEVARAAGATVVTASLLPEGWTGKNWACWTGARATAAPVVAFLDADTRLEPGGLARLLAERRRRGGLVSAQPYHAVERPYEVLSALFNLVAMMGTDAFTPLGERLSPRGAFGPCLACARTDYLAAGGHAAVRADVVDDVALARRFLAAGLPVACLGGRGTVRFRMYPRGLGQLVEGWSKNVAAGAGGTRLLTLALVGAWVWGLVSASVGAAVFPFAWAAVLYAAHAAQLSWMLRRVGSFGVGAALAFPVLVLAFLGIFARSLVLTLGTGRVSWKGRRVPVGRR